MSFLRRLAQLIPDLAPLRESRDFRILWWAGSIFYLGQMLTYVAVPWLVYQLTESNLAVGLVGLAELLPMIVFGLYGGALADHGDRRKILVVTGALQLVFTAALALNALLPEPSLVAIYVLSALLSAAGSAQRPAREALVPRTVTHQQLPAAMSLASLGTHIGLLLGPSLGGLLLVWKGSGWCFAIDAFGLLLATVLFSRLREYPHTSDTEPPSIGSIGRGVKYALGRRDLLGTYVVDIAAMFFALPVALFPALAHDVFKQPQVLGLLYTAEIVGSLIATATSGWTARINHHGRVIVLAAAAYGGFVALAGVSHALWLVLVCLGLSGAADMISALFRQIIWNQTIPDTMRGRLAGLEMLSYSVGPYGGQVRAGVTADLWTARGAMASGGLACIVGVGLTAVWLRDFWSYDTRTNEYAVAERSAREATA